jgi:hypothetical protein
MAAMREKHRDEVDELERTLSKKERERKELEDDCRDLRNELESSKGEVRDLKVRFSFGRSQHRPLILTCMTLDGTICSSHITAHCAGRAAGITRDQRPSATGNREPYIERSASRTSGLQGE